MQIWIACLRFKWRVRDTDLTRRGTVRFEAPPTRLRSLLLQRDCYSLLYSKPGENIGPDLNRYNFLLLFIACSTDLDFLYCVASRSPPPHMYIQDVYAQDFQPDP